ncbi:COX15/CtaA family protein [Pseudolysinimonas kribbensis]|uniref:Cytochrome b561 n=1 Tax=Pseudolysinimonas kribbensis TaxID=433641 RepID=A0ABQ6KB57_9MICO|nr:COX15/CtaA family protein [Pseudolysinimonas kribbensis]GMA93179.1 cytochrome b561 [Pseudolysinimonas kribbensis]GMA97087.1 cytochrome b561 [Pseudolysinimonas kribbensis]
MSRIVTPFAWAASRWTLGPRALRWGTTAALVMSVVIVLGGAIVRVTSSGLGCSTWPTCDGHGVLVVPDTVHQLIEQSNRTLTGVLVVAVGWAIIAVRLQRPWDRALTRLAWSMFWLVIVNAVAGGITVLAGLNPWVVALHFVLAMALLATATLTWHRARWRGTPGAVVTPRARGMGWAVVVASAGLVIVGTIVTGAGPHSGDSTDLRHLVPRNGFDWGSVVWVHGLLAALVILLAVATLLLVPAARRRAIVFLVVLLLQGAVGLVQSLTALPELLVVIHVLGAALVWVGAIRVLLDADPALFPLRSAASAHVEVLDGGTE